MRFYRQEYWNGLPFSPLGDLSDPGVEPSLAGRFFTTLPPGKMLLLLSRFSRVRLCVTPQMEAHQAPPSLGFSRQEHWSGLPFPSPVHESESEVSQSCPTHCNPMDCSPPGSSVHGIFQARGLEWVAIAFSGWKTGEAILPCLGGGSPLTGKKGAPEPVALKGALSNQQHPGLGPFRVAPRTSSRCSEPALVSCLVLACTLLSKQTRHSGSSLLANTPDLATAPRINKHAARLRTRVLPAVRRDPMGPRP